MKILITGASGFIGNRLLHSARAAYGESVAAFTSGPITGSHIVYRDGSGFGLIPKDLDLIGEVEILIHAGAFTPKSVSDSNQVPGCNSNIEFTQKLLDLPWNKLRRIIYLSTVDVYEEVSGPITETSPTIPASLYGFSKLYCERLVTLYSKEKLMASQILRLGHVYGPGEEKYAKVVPKAIRDILLGNNVELWGEGTELRSFIYIDDVIHSIHNAIELSDEPGVINVSGSNAISIRELLELLVSIGGRGTVIEQREYLGETRNLLFDNAKLRRYLLKEETELRVGLEAEFRHVENLISVSP